MPTPPTPITSLPTPPSRSDPANFAARGDAFLGALPTFATEANTIATTTYNNAVDAGNSATNALNSASSAAVQANAAAQSAASAASAAGATKWVSGQSYTEGAVVWSPISFLNYRRKTSGSGSVDPSNDSVNWVLLGVSSNFPTSTINSSTSASASIHYVFTASLTLSLPSNPNIGSSVQFTDLSGTKTSVINPGSEKIRGVSGSMTLNTNQAEAILTYSGSTLGWV